MRSFLALAGITLVLLTVTAEVSAEPARNFDLDSPGGGSSIFQMGNVPSLKSMSLLDPERFTMRQETVMSYSSSGMMGSNMQGMYINTMEYRFQMPLTMRLRVAYENNMGSLLGNKSMTGRDPGMETGRLYVPSFDIVYQPWENTFISFHYRDFSGMTNNMYNPYSRYNMYGSPYGYFR